MRFNSALLLLGLVGVVSAHFQLQFPPPRGPFVEDDEPNFCDGFMTPAANRTQFPLNGGFFTLNSEHPQWTVGVLVSFTANPTSFDNFTQIVPFFKDMGEGAFCIPLDFPSNVNGTNLQDGKNVTIQIIFDGGDGMLYQCADLTLSSSFKISSDVACNNATGNSGSSGSSPTATEPLPSPSTTNPSTAGAKGMVTPLG